jgi:hypothetical protein
MSKKKKNLLSLTLTDLKKTATLHARDFAEGRAAHAVLAPFADADAAIAALAPRSALADAEKGVVIAAMIIEHQRTGRRFWGALLSGVFEGALLRIRGRLGREVDPEIDQRVLVAFCEAISNPSLAASRHHAAIAVTRAMKKIVFGDTLAERADPTLEEFVDASHEPDAPCLGDEPVEDAIAVELRNAFATLGDPEEVADMLHATFVVGEALSDYVDRTHPALDREARVAVYERLRRKRYEAIRRLRANPRFRALTERQDFRRSA